MLSSFKLMMAKNDPDKLLELFETNKDLRISIIEKLFEFMEYDKLIYLAEINSANRSRIMEKILDIKELSLNEVINILKWMNIGSTQRRLIKYIINTFKGQEIKEILKNDDIDQIAKSSLKTAWEKRMEELKLDKVDEEYLKLKMLIEEYPEVQLTNKNEDFLKMIPIR